MRTHKDIDADVVTYLRCCWPATLEQIQHALAEIPGREVEFSVHRLCAAGRVRQTQRGVQWVYEVEATHDDRGRVPAE